MAVLRPKRPQVDGSSPLAVGSGGAAVGPLIYIPSGSGELEKRMSIAGVVANGTAEDSAAMQAALNADSAPGHHMRQFPPVKAIRCDTGLVVDVSNRHINGMGVKLDFSGVASGPALTLTQILDNEIAANIDTMGNVLHGLSFLDISGSGGMQSSATDGVVFTGSSGADAKGSARSYLSRSIVRGFRTGITYSHRSYLSEAQGCEVFQNDIGVLMRSTAVDAYENTRMVGGAVYNNNCNVYVEEGQLYLNGLSLDYAGMTQMAVRAGLLSLQNCHVEFSILSPSYNFAGGIYGAPPPLCAIDMLPGGSGVALAANKAFAFSTAATNSAWAVFRMNGGMLALQKGGVDGDPALATLVNIGDFGNAKFGGDVHVYMVAVPSSGYLAHRLTARNTVSEASYTGNMSWAPATWAGNDIPHIAFEQPSYIASQPGRGLCVSPTSNEMISWGFNLTGTPGFQAGGILEDMTLIEDTATITSRLSGANGSAALDTADGAGGTTKSLKITKVGAQGTPLKFLIKVPARYRESRPVFRGYLRKSAGAAPTVGSFNINIGYGHLTHMTLGAVAGVGVRHRWVDDTRLVPGGVAGAGNSSSAKNPAALRFAPSSMYVPVDSGTTATDIWVPFQLNGNNDVWAPAYGADIGVEIDLANMGPGSVSLDLLALEWL